MDFCSVSMSMLELSEALSQRCRDSGRTLQLLEALTRAVGVSVPTGSLRELVLRALFVHTDHHDDAVLVAVARALLTVCTLFENYLGILNG